MSDKNAPVLVVDHLPMVRRMVRQCLRKLGYENVQEADSLPAAAEMLESNNFKLVISDCEMPECNPQQFLRAVRTSVQTKEAPILFIASSTVRLPTLDDTRVGFIQKPFTAQHIEKRLSAFCES